MSLSYSWRFVNLASKTISHSLAFPEPEMTWICEIYYVHWPSCIWRSSYIGASLVAETTRQPSGNIQMPRFWDYTDCLTLSWKGNLFSAGKKIPPISTWWTTTFHLKWLITTYTGGNIVRVLGTGMYMWRS